jgi:hypothetical protein
MTATLNQVGSFIGTLQKATTTALSQKANISDITGINKYYEVNSEAAMLALQGLNTGDFCIRDDTASIYRLTTTPANNINNWKILIESYQSITPTLITSASLTTLRSNLLLGSANVRIGSRYQLTDGILSGQVVEWNGEAFNNSTKSTMRIFSRYSTTAIASRTSNNSTDATPVAIESVTIPGFLMGSNSKLKIVPFLAFDNVNSGNSNTKTIWFNLQVGNVNNMMSGVSVNGGTLTSKLLWELENSGILTAQSSFNNTSYSNASGAPLTFGINTVADFNINLIASWGANCTASSTINLIGLTIELVP